MGYMTSVWSLVACFGRLQDRTQIPRMESAFQQKGQGGRSKRKSSLGGYSRASDVRLRHRQK